MTVRFFMLQSHYSSTLDFSNEALGAAQKGYKKLANGLRIVKKMKYVDDGENIDEGQIAQLSNTIDACRDAMNDNFNTALTISGIQTDSFAFSSPRSTTPFVACAMAEYCFGCKGRNQPKDLFQVLGISVAARRSK